MNGFLKAAVAEAKMFPKTASNHMNRFLKAAVAEARMFPKQPVTI